MDPIFKIDASKQYSEGQELHVLFDGTFGMFKIMFKQGGVPPEELQGAYSNAKFAKKDIEFFLERRSKELEIKERRKAVKVGKEKWAKKKAAEALNET